MDPPPQRRDPRTLSCRLWTLHSPSLAGGSLSPARVNACAPTLGVKHDPRCCLLPRQESWSGLPFPFPGDPNPGIEPVSFIARWVLYHWGTWAPCIKTLQGPAFPLPHCRPHPPLWSHRCPLFPGRALAAGPLHKVAPQHGVLADPVTDNPPPAPDSFLERFFGIN